MLKEKIMSVHHALGEVLGNAKLESDAALLRLCRQNLEAAAEMAENMENSLEIPAPFLAVGADKIEVKVNIFPAASNLYRPLAALMKEAM